MPSHRPAPPAPSACSSSHRALARPAALTRPLELDGHARACSWAEPRPPPARQCASTRPRALRPGPASSLRAACLRPGPALAPRCSGSHAPSAPPRQRSRTPQCAWIRPPEPQLLAQP
ncbi:uncharacterized protein LOC112898163 [Panicum hallii]|uniref:uncharacterized protein LOC112898163 n=1 Tax=Panicum hallii TaxID=206008 RepID=UPI000DF4CEBE|nr:uncharacterized protein LOC112898163 [Panicum hallii]